ncbi:ABC transporter permease [Microvirga antarctica]|uniref:ABC transporter permease n=1 Tax=Microvirga antarctica TaxID=2819233 RepID=UPI001B30517B|nr:ABC transporter permease [Microvirga antarctica]
MTRYALWRIGAVIPVLLGVTFAVFFMLHVLPLDPIQVMITQTSSGQAPSASATEQTIANLRRELGLDRPLYVQYASFLFKGLSGDLGISFRSHQPVVDLLLAQYPYTIRLALAGLLCAVVLGTTFGIIAGLMPGSLVDKFLLLVATLGIAAPSFWLGLMLIYFLAIVFPIFPVLGVGRPEAILLPALTLGLPGAAIIARLTRSNLAATMKEDFIVTARSKGLSRRLILLKHALPNVLLPVLTVIGLQFGNLMTGTVIVETVFSRPGIGRLGVDAILQSDYPIVQGFAVVLATTYVFVNLIIDLAYMWLDPRIRYA